MHIRFLSWDGQSFRPLYVQTDADTFERLDLRSNRRSPRIEVPRASTLRLFVDGLDEEGNPIKVPVTDVSINEQINEPLLMLFERVDGDSPPVALVFEDTEEAFPFGSYRVVNFTEYPIVFELEGDAHSISPRSSVLVNPKNDARENLTMRLLASIDGEARLIRQTYWRHQPEQRMLVFAVTSRDSRRKEVLLRTVAERKTVYEQNVENMSLSESVGDSR